MMWIFICINLLAIANIFYKETSGNLNHVNPSCLSKVKIIILGILAALILLFRIIVQFVHTEVTSDFYEYLLMAYFFCNLRIAATSGLPGKDG